MKPVIYPYKMESESAKKLADALGCKRVFPDGKYKPKPNHLIINWGSAKVPNWLFGSNYWMNTPQQVNVARNKTLTFETLHHDLAGNLPTWTRFKSQAQLWLSEGTVVLARTTLTGHSGEGIVRVTSKDDLPEAPLYVRYIKKDAEYRLHVCGEEVVDIQRKKKRNGWKDNPNYNPFIRSYNNGWVFCREDVTVDDSVKQLAIAGVAQLGLSFGAVDIIREVGTNQHYLLEVHTAPGLEGQTLDTYVSYFKEELV